MTRQTFHEFPATDRRIILDLLDHRTAFRERLEEQIVGPGLRRLVADLEALAGAGPPPPPLPQALCEQAVAGGLAALSDQAFRELMGRPRNLLALQRVVLTAGGPGRRHWDQVIARWRNVPRPDRRRRPWFAHPAFTPAAAAAGAALAAGVAVLLALPPAGQPAASNDDLKRALAAANRALDELRAEHPLVTPADLPGDLGSPRRRDDPPDLPEGEPADLP
jgi:hypothetical protein